MHRIGIISALFAGGLSLAGLAWATPGSEIQALLEKNQAAEAYALGKRQAESLGDPAFDFYFGIAAVEAGHAGEGVLALERYLLNYPDNRSARFQLARAYYVLGEDLRARDEFEALLPAAEGAERVAIERFLAAIRGREARYSPTANAWLEAGIGFDSNINAGLKGGATPTIPGLGALPALASNSISAKEGDSFTLLSAGVQGVYPVAPGVALTGSVGLDARYHHGAHNDIFDQLNAGISGGASFLRGQNLYKLGLGFAQMRMDEQDYVFTSHLSGEWSHQYDQYNRFDLGAQIARLSYDDMQVYPVKDKSAPMVTSNNSVRSADFYGLNGSWTHVFGGEFRPVLKLGASYGEERNQRDRPDLSRNLLGLRAQLQFAPAPRWGASIGLGYQDIEHRATFAFPGVSVARQDQVWSLDVGLSYQYQPNLTLRADYIHTDQSSNVGIYEYQRDQLVFKLRYDFK